MDDKACDFLREVDNLFNNKGVNVVKFNKFTKYYSYCPYQNGSKENKCTNDYERINALGSYLHKKISELDENYKKQKGVSQHIELFMIWLGGRLFKIENDYKATLEESYKKHLEKHMGNYDYWKLIDSKKHYKNATIKKMSDIYGLLNNICKLINEYNKSTTTINRSNLRNTSTQCLNFYRVIYNSVNGCKPYLYLLDSLKMMYEIFRTTKMVNNNFKSRDKDFLNTQIKPITTFGGENKLFVTVVENLSFDDKECREVKSNDEKIGEQIESKKLQSKLKDPGLPKKIGTTPQGRASGNFPPANPPVQKPAPLKPSAPKPPERSPVQTQQPPQKSETNHQSGANGSDSKEGNKGGGEKVLGGAVSRPESSERKLNDAEQKKPIQVGTPSPGPKVSSQSTGVGNQGNGEGSRAGGQGRSPGGISSETGSGTGDQGISPGGTSSETGSGTGDQGGSGNQVNTGSQTKPSMDPPDGNPAPGLSGTGTPQSSGSPSSPGTPQSPAVSQPGPPPAVPPKQKSEGQPPSSKPAPQPVPQPAPQPVPQPEPQPVQQPDSLLPSSDPQKSDPPASPPESPPSGSPLSQNSPELKKTQTGGSNNSNESKDSGNDKGSTGGTNDNTGGSGSGNENPGGGSNVPTSNTSEGSFNFGSSFLEFILKGKEYYNKGSNFIKDNQQKFKDATEKISGAYNQAKDKLKTTYDESNKYLNQIIKDVFAQFKKNDTPSKSNDKQPDPGRPIDGGKQSNQSPSAPPINPPPQTPTLNLPSPTPTKDPPTNQTSIPPIDPTSQKQSSSQPKPITQDLTQVNQPNHQKIDQLVKSISSNQNLKKTWNIFPTTWNGSNDCKPEINFMNATLVCCTSKQCSLTGISVTLVLIPIILLIAYKYLSFGSSKKLEKKNMKKVINFHDGNRKTKIIISSHDKKKKLKPIINSVDGKKGPLLNIYKLIHADPIPFINLFFLLIFFVYKRKRDTIEL
ncbi:PIR protein CIR protein [Plasmodium vinckei vinckei]|uniref:PIR protein CIR protein n=1 Tax=Plasmodium vinckei vinckei TaxID=54757 RepID=A0A449BN81_PLAVN|nr:PIR protein CIR protein [Plasmodium vinckei vinckei]VEV54916.1 PIR protein CIR protein [Plasmodium vinckei vinckei]